MRATRRVVIGGILGSLGTSAVASLYPSIIPPDPGLWHIDTVPNAEGYAPGPNGRIYYRRYGKAGRVPVLVLHGGPAAGETYMRPYVGLATDRQVVLYDQSGCGRSAAPADLTHYTLERYVDEVEALRTHLGLSQIVLLGHSWGGFLASAYTARYPERVVALVLAGSASKVQDFADAAHRWLKEFGPEAVALVAQVEHGASPDNPAFQALTDRYYRRHLCRLEPWPAFLDEAGQRIAANPVYKYLNGPSEFEFTGTIGTLNVGAALQAIEVPALVTCGEFDEAPRWVGEKLASHLSRATLHVFPNRSHMAHIEDPAAVTAVTAAFLRHYA